MTVSWNDFRAVKAHPFFQSINWEDLENKRITPPFKPKIVDDMDTRNFDSEFTDESLELTPTDHQSPLAEEDDKYFPNFSYRGVSVLGDVHEWNIYFENNYANNFYIVYGIYYSNYYVVLSVKYNCLWR